MINAKYSKFSLIFVDAFENVQLCGNHWKLILCAIKIQIINLLTFKYLEQCGPSRAKWDAYGQKF